MLKGKKILGLIPARGGSKGLPGKNLKNLSGKPLIAWTVEASLQSKYIDKTVVTTDSKDIASIAKKYGASTPFLRPAELAGDTARSVDAVFHTLEQLAKAGEIYDITVFMQPTSPLRTAENIDNALEYFFKKKANSVISVCECEHSPVWSNILPHDNNMTGFVREEYKNLPRQKIPTHYRINGAIYIGYNNYIKENDGFLAKETCAYIMEEKNSVDIDTIIDFKLAEIILGEKE